MRFIDEAKIKLKAGHGGSGCVSFRREKYVPMGGPDGGDGGRGGNVSFRTTNKKATLADFRLRRTYGALGGKPGGGKNKSGRAGGDLVISVPVGTIIKDENGQVLVDLIEEGQEWFGCMGGRGGKGNAHFVSSTFQAPRFAQDGEAGEERLICLELKLLADVGIIGYPNAGKSTLISKLSSARPKIGDYHFTTRTPNLGVVELNGDRSIVVADIPGLIEGAHQGHGMGIEFLRHIERTRLLVHVIDGAALLETSFEEDDAAAVEKALNLYKTIRKELQLYNPTLTYKPEMVVINKSDLLSPTLLGDIRTALRQNINSIRESHPEPLEPFCISALTGDGLKVLLKELDRRTLEMVDHSETSPEKVVLPDGSRAQMV